MSTGETGGAQKPRTPEEEEAEAEAGKCIKDCHVETLLSDTKFLQIATLQQLVKQIILGSNVDKLRYPSPVETSDKRDSRGTSPINSNDDQEDERDEAMAVFFLELLVRIAIQNKDRVADIWPGIVTHMKSLIDVSAPFAEKSAVMLERSVNSLLRMAVRLARKEELASLVVQSLSLLESLGNQALYHVARHIAFGLYELLRNNAANIHETEDWGIIFCLVEMVGAGVVRQDAQGDGKNHDEDSGHESSASTRERSGSIGSSSGGWIVLEKTTETNQAKYEYINFLIVQISDYDSFFLVKTSRVA